MLIQEAASSNDMALVIAPYQEQAVKIFLHSSAHACNDDEKLYSVELPTSST